MQDPFDARTVSAAARNLARSLTPEQRHLLKALYDCTGGSVLAFKEAADEVFMGDPLNQRGLRDRQVDVVLLSAVRNEIRRDYPVYADKVRADVLGRATEIGRETLEEMRIDLLQAKRERRLAPAWQSFAIALDGLLAPSPSGP